MKYMLLIYSDETAWTEREREAYFSESIELTQQLQERGQYRVHRLYTLSQPQLRWTVEIRSGLPMLRFC